MKRTRQVISFALVIAFAGLGLIATAHAQQRTYRWNDRQMQQLLTRIDTRANRFSNSLDKALDRSRLDGTKREDDINTLLTDFKNSTDQLHQRFNNRQSTMTDAETVLRQGALLNSFMQRHQIANGVERQWTLLRNDLSQLASAYNVAWNWSNPPAWTPPVQSVGYDGMLTGTYRLDRARSQNTRDIATRATRGLPYNQRQNIYDRLVARLDPPEMIAIERHGNNVQLASTRAAQVAIDVDGVERVEQYPNGRSSHVRATFAGGQLTVVSNGDRSNDFTATFEPIENGRRLLVTRRVYAERLNQPVVVQAYYDKTSDVAQWNVYDGRSWPSTGSTTANFIIPDGTMVTAVLNNNLSTRRSREGDRFTMTVREPGSFSGAVIEGHVSDVNPSGRITGRSQMVLNFDRIRLRNGQSYAFAGLINNVETMNGESVRVDNEGSVAESDNQTDRTLTRTAIGTAIGAIIGAVSGGGKGAAIGAVVGAGAGAGSVYVQGRDQLDLMSGSRVTIRAGAPR